MTTSPFARRRPARRPLAPPEIALVLLVVIFAAWFSAYSLRLHDAHLTHKADLGQIDLAIWNTAHGRFVQEVKGDAISTRLTDHVEPIFIPISWFFWLWDDVRFLLILQALALAAGAWPVFLLARARLAQAGLAEGAGWGGLVFAAAYLLTPALEAPIAADFHAFPFAAPLIAWAFWALERRRWGVFIAAALLVAAVQEGLALLAATLGAFALAREMGAWLKTRRARNRTPGLAVGTPGRGVAGMAAGLAVCLAGLGWFYVTTAVIIPRFAAPVYGVDTTPYAARYGALGDTLGSVLKAFVTRPALVWSTLTEPLRLRYLVGLLAPTAFLALLGPEILLLSLPLLLANLLSGYVFQYSGELHYSSPLAPFFTVAAIVGLGRLLGWARRARAESAAGHAARVTTSASGAGAPGAGSAAAQAQIGPKAGPAMNLHHRASRVTGAGAALAVIVACALAYHAWAGYTPLAREFWRRLPGGWPAVTAHQRLLDRFVARIPAADPVSATADLYPHLSHRELLYQFPTVAQARWVLVDVSGGTDLHPADVYSTLNRLLQSGWGIADAADGYMLLRRGDGRAQIPDVFYDFARTTNARPQYPLDVVFGGKLRLLGYDVLDDVKWRRTGFRFYWQALAPLPADLAIAVQVAAPDGSVIDDSSLRPMPATLWYPPARWRPGETVMTEKTPWYLPAAWAPLLRVTAGETVLTPQVAGNAAPAGVAAASDGRLVLSAWTRRQGALTPLPAPAWTPANVQFRGPGWAVELAGSAVPGAAQAGAQLPVMLSWRALQSAPAGRDYTVFLQLRDTAGRTVAGGDATPTWFAPAPTTRWQGQPAAYTTWDAHSVALPPHLAPGRYNLVLGWYYWESGERLAVSEPDGNAAGNEYVVASVSVEARRPASPDLACLVAAEACASQ